MQPLAGLDLLGSFLILAEELNFRRSAERLSLDQSALARGIQKLEHLLGFKLLERTTREVVLTGAGHSFFRDNVGLLEGYRDSIDAARRVAEGRAGVLRIAYMTFAATRLMPQAVTAFTAAHPHIDLSVTYLRTQAQKLALAKGEIDVGFMIDPFDHPDFTSLVLASEPLFVILPPGHALLQRSNLCPADLAGEPMILGTMQEWDEYRWRLDDLFSSEGVALNLRLEASHTLAIAGLVAAGMGATVFPQSLLGMLGPDVAVRPLDHPASRSSTALVWRRANKSDALKAFTNMARARLRAEAASA